MKGSARGSGKLDYIERGHCMFPYPKPPKYMCVDCFRIFSKRRKGKGETQRCTCGAKELARLDPTVPIPKRKANNKEWKEFFNRNFLSVKAKLYYQIFKMIKAK